MHFAFDRMLPHRMGTSPKSNVINRHHKINNYVQYLTLDNIVLALSVLQ